MWHVDEGALHAYLDGALDEYPAAEARRVREHVETCRQCAERLAEARVLRDEASRILTLATPAVEVPALEDLRARLRARSPERRRTPTRLYRIGWAASVVLALGAGWVLRGGIPSWPSARVQAPLAPGGTTAADADGGGMDLPGRPTGPRAVAAPVSPVAAEAASPSLAAATAGEGEARVATAPPLEPDVASDAVPRSASPDAVGALVAAAEARVRSIEPVVTIPSPALQPLRLRVAAPETGARAPAAMTAVSAPDGARADSGRPADVERGRVLTSAASAGGAAPGVSLGRGTLDDDDVTDPRGDEPISLVVPGLEVIGVQPVGEGTTFAGLRALQRLPGGDTLEIFHLPESVHPSMLPARAPGHNELLRQRGEGWVVLRALLTEPELQALLQRLESGS